MVDSQYIYLPLRLLFDPNWKEMWMGLAKLSSVVYQDLQLFVSFGGSISGLLRILDFKWLPDKIVS